MMQAAIDIHTLVEAGTAIFVLAGFITTLMIKNNQATVKEELLAKQVEMRQDMDEKHAENSKTIAVHAASDEGKFDFIGRTLTRIDGKLDALNGKTH